MKVCCVFSLESPHRGDSNEYTQHTIFSSPGQSRKSYCTTPGVSIGGGVGVGGEMLKFLHSSFLCDGQGAVRQAILSL